LVFLGVPFPIEIMFPERAQVQTDLMFALAVQTFE